MKKDQIIAGIILVVIFLCVRFYFMPESSYTTKSSEHTKNIIQEAKEALELVALQEAKDKNSVYAYKKFLAKYPNGKFADEAKKLIVKKDKGQTQEQKKIAKRNAKKNTLDDILNSGSTKKIMKLVKKLGFSKELSARAMRLANLVTTRPEKYRSVKSVAVIYRQKDSALAEVARQFIEEQFEKSGIKTVREVKKGSKWVLDPPSILRFKLNLKTERLKDKFSEIKYKHNSEGKLVLDTNARTYNLDIGLKLKGQLQVIFDESELGQKKFFGEYKKSDAGLISVQQDSYGTITERNPVGVVFNRVLSVEGSLINVAMDFIGPILGSQYLIDFYIRSVGKRRDYALPILQKLTGKKYSRKAKWKVWGFRNCYIYKFLAEYVSSPKEKVRKQIAKIIGILRVPKPYDDVKDLKAELLIPLIDDSSSIVQEVAKKAFKRISGMDISSSEDAKKWVKEKVYAYENL
ncbi:hypothetical protein KAJ27_03610 [bacterium]|nr:hypothetical protein [bacterium]